jgi:hypothetical protein
MPSVSDLKVLPPGSWKTPKFKLPTWVHEYNCVKVGLAWAAIVAGRVGPVGACCSVGDQEGRRGEGVDPLYCAVTCNY